MIWSDNCTDGYGLKIILLTTRQIVHTIKVCDLNMICCVNGLKDRELPCSQAEPTTKVFVT